MVFVSSKLHQLGELDFADLNFSKGGTTGFLPDSLFDALLLCIVASGCLTLRSALCVVAAAECVPSPLVGMPSGDRVVPL